MPPAPSPKKSPAKAPFSVTGRTPPPAHTPRPAYLANRRAPRDDHSPRPQEERSAAEQPRPVPVFRDSTDEIKTPDTANPPARAVHVDAPLSDRSASESRSNRDRSASPTKASVLPCVAHPVYTKHQNCGCLRSRSASPNKHPPAREPPTKTKPVWDAPPPPPRPPSPPPPPTFEAPHRLASLNCQNLRHVAATGPMTVMSTEGNGSSVKARNSVTGVTLPAEDANGNPTALPTPEVAITAMASVDDYVWCGFLDGTVRVFRRDTNELVCEPPMKHAGAVQCFAHVPSQGAVFSGSADWKIFKWTRSGPSQWRGVLYAGHSLGVRDLCEAEVATGTYLCSAGDDAEIRCWLLAASSASAIQGADRSSSPPSSPNKGSPTAAPTPAVLKKHRDSVLSCMHAFGHLWTGGEDTTVRRWDIDKQRQVAELAGHSSGVLSMKRVSSSVWTLGKDGTGIMFDGESSAAVHTMSFIDGGIKAGVPRTFAAQLFYVMPVVGHVLWISDPAGRTAAWFAPAALNDAAADAGASRALRGDAEAAFVDSERYVELVFEAEESQRQMLKAHGDLVEGHTATVASAVEEGYARAVREMAIAADGAATADEMAQLRDRIQELELLLNHANEDIAVPAPAPAADGADRIGTHDDDFVAELQADLAAAKGIIGELQQQLAVGDEADAIEKLRALANEARQAALAAEQERDAALAEVDDANAAMLRLRENMDCDTGVLDQRIQDLEKEVTELRLELDSKAVEIAALRIAKEEAERPSDELSRLRERVIELEHAETERDMARQELSEASALLKQLQAELHDRDEMLDKLLMEKDDAVARLSQVDVDSMKTLTDARTETKRLARMLEEANAEMRALRESEQDWKDIAEQRHADLLRLNGEMKDRDKNEAAVRVSYEERIAELVDRLRALEEALGANEEVSGSLSAAEADRDALRAKLAEFTSPRYQDLLNENVELKRQLGEHKSHINRLLENDSKTEALLRDLRERARQSRAEEAVRFSARQRSASPSDNGPHDPTCPHHRASCIWCSGAINISMGTTLNTGRNNHRSPSSQERSRSRSPGGSNGRSNSAVAAPSALKGAGPSSGVKRSESAPTQAAVDPPTFDGSPRTQQRKKDRRVHQLEQAKEATGNEAVRAALVEQILSIHKTFINKDVPRGEDDV